jgi:SAM-dependent methyltransferase
MRLEAARTLLRCPVCRSEKTLELRATASDAVEVREGELVCSRCATRFPVRRGVAELLVDPPAHVVREAAGLERFAAAMAEHGWTQERVLNLPYEQDGYWYVQATSFDQIMREVNPPPGARVLDVGSNTCWATSLLAKRGLEAVALDISTVEMQGLHTADWWFARGVYFERVLGSMTDMPIASGSLDYVFCCEVLHHNDRPGLAQTFREAFRVLRPGGQLLVVNETLKRLTDPGGVHLGDMAQFEGHEHAHWAVQYRLQARRAGFRTRVLAPAYHPFFAVPELHLPPGTGSLRALREAAYYIARHSSLTRRAYLMWLNHVRGQAQITMVATKP